MPVKTTTCSFSEEKIYPGRGVQFVRRDGKKVTFLNCKNRHLGLAGRKALKLRWTKAWRRAHKKESILRSVRKDKGRRTVKSERGIQGMSLQELLRKKNESAAERQKAQLKKGAQQKPQSKAGKKADLNERLRALRRARQQKEKAKEEKETDGKGGKGRPRRRRGGKGGAKERAAPRAARARA